MTVLPETEMVEHWNLCLQIFVRKEYFTFASFSPDGKQIVTGSHDITAQMWDTETGEGRHKLREHKDAVTQVVFSPDGKKIASASEDYIIRL